MERALDGIWIALALDGNGGASELHDWDAIRRAPEHAPLWIHLDPSSARARRWLATESGIREDALVEFARKERRPRLTVFEHGGVLVALRGLAPELEQGAEDLTLMHLFAEPNRIVSACVRALPGVEVTRARYARGEGARDVPALLVLLAGWLDTSIQTSANDIEEPLAELEYTAERSHADTSHALHQLQGRVTRLRRHLTPFKVLLGRLLELEGSWLTAGHEKDWRSLFDQAEDTDVLLQSLHERLTSLHDYVSERLNRVMNETLYRLTIFSTILLPLTFVTGIFGMNIGIRGASYELMESTPALLLVVVSLFGLAWLEYLLARKRRLLLPRVKSQLGPQSRGGARCLGVAEAPRSSRAPRARQT